MKMTINLQWATELQLQSPYELKYVIKTYGEPILSSNFHYFMIHWG